MWIARSRPPAESTSSQNQDTDQPHSSRPQATSHKEAHESADAADLVAEVRRVLAQARAALRASGQVFRKTRQGVEVPGGLKSGDKFKVLLDGKQEHEMRVPAGLKAGDRFFIDLAFHISPIPSTRRAPRPWWERMRSAGAEGDVLTLLEAAAELFDNPDAQADACHVTRQLISVSPRLCHALAAHAAVPALAAALLRHLPAPLPTLHCADALANLLQVSAPSESKVQAVTAAVLGAALSAEVRDHAMRRSVLSGLVHLAATPEGLAAVNRQQGLPAAVRAAVWSYQGDPAVLGEGCRLLLRAVQGGGAGQEWVGAAEATALHEAWLKAAPRSAGIDYCWVLRHAVHGKA